SQLLLILLTISLLVFCFIFLFFFFSSRRRHTRFSRDWSSDVCSSDLSWRGAELPWSPRVIPRPSTKAPSATSKKWDFCKAKKGRSEERRVGKECRCGWAADE